MFYLKANPVDGFFKPLSQSRQSPPGRRGHGPPSYLALLLGCVPHRTLHFSQLFSSQTMTVHLGLFPGPVLFYSLRQNLIKLPGPRMWDPHASVQQPARNSDSHAEGHCSHFTDRKMEVTYSNQAPGYIRCPLFCIPGLHVGQEPSRMFSP